MPEKKLSFSQFEIAHLRQVLPLLEKILHEHYIDFYILGGLARDVHFLNEGITPKRITRDIDIAAFIPDPPDYEKLMQDLAKIQGFERMKDNPIRLQHSSGVAVDILPFDEMTSSGGAMERFGPAFAEFTLRGLHEVFKRSTSEFFIEEAHSYQVTTLEAIIFLKLLAYDAKPEWRQKDLEDIAQLLLCYFDFNDNDIYENHNDLFENERSLEAVSARVIGRKINAFLTPNSRIKEIFYSMLNKYIEKPQAPIFLILAKEMKKTPEEILECFEEIRTGFNEKK